MILVNSEKKKRVSKKTKSSWRKHVNIQDVDNFLEEQRLEERLGAPFSSLRDDELFTLETSVEKHLTAKKKKRLRLAAPPKCFAMLQPHTKVPDPIKKRNRVRTKEERMCPILKKKANERKLKGILKPREMQSMNDRKKYEEKKINEEIVKENVVDIWNNKDNFMEDSWVDKNTKRHTLRGIGKLNKVVPRLKIATNTAIPSVEIPHPGTSYNPSYKDHNDLLQEIVEKEAEIIKQEKHINRVTKDMFRKVSAGKTDDTWLIEMSQGLPDSAELTDANVDVENNDDKPYKSVNAPVINKKKTRQQRRKQKEQLLLKKAKLLAKLEKKKVADMHKLKLISSHIEKREKKLEKLKEKREKIKLTKDKEPKQLSKIKFEEPDVEFSMGQDLTGNLKDIKKQGHLLVDRFRSLQKRNILEVTSRHNRKKSKVKKFVKPGFKDNWKKTVANVNLLKAK